MKTTFVAAALFVATAATVAVSGSLQGPPPAQPDPLAALPPRGLATQVHPRVEVVFVLDTTGSMGGLIEAAKQKIWSIARTMASAQPAPEIRMGLVAYRDLGDDYVTQIVDLSTDLDAVYLKLLSLQAAGGGDHPESVNQALDDTLQRISWSRDTGTYRVVFLVGDAPPHMDYPNERPYSRILADADTRDIVINTIQCGDAEDTQRVWRDIAQLGRGHYAQVDQGGSAVALATPFDEALARLSEELDGTRLYYGSAETQLAGERRKESSQVLRSLAPAAALAGRAAFNASDSGVANFAGDGELLSDMESGRVELETLEEDSLPPVLQPLAPAARRAQVAEIAEKRRELSEKIDAVSRQRADYLSNEVAAMGGAEDSLDQRIYNAIREQGAAKGLDYAAEKPRY
jgi:uncharacterized protein YegL